MKRYFVGALLFLCAVAAGAQTTTITASNIAQFGGNPITGTFCVTPTDMNGNPLNLSTPGGQQFSQTTPLCFTVTAGVLQANANVPDTSLTQPVNACYRVTINDTTGKRVGSYPCIQPIGATWSFDNFVPGSLPSIPLLQMPLFSLNGHANQSQSYLDLVCTGCTNNGGHITIPAASGTANLAANTLYGNNTGVTAAAAALTVSQVQTLLGLGTAAYTPTTAYDAAGAAATAQANVTALIPVFKLNGTNNPTQGYLDLICPSCTVSAGHVTLPAPGTGTSPNQTLSCSSDLGAQVASAITALGSAGGKIIIPPCAAATWTTAVANVPPNISIIGSGQYATQITCSVAGKCLTYHEPWTRWTNTSISSGAEIAGFTMIGSATTASNQTLISGEGLNGFLIHDVALNGADSSHEPTCMEFRNTATDNTFTERNITYNFQFGQQCKTSVHFVQEAGDGDNSFGYNLFQFSVAPTGPNYGLVFDGAANLYGGSLTVIGNYVGTGGGILQFNGGFSTGSPPGGGPLEKLLVSVENNSNDTTAHIISVTNSASNLQFSGDVWSGSPSAFGWTTPIYNPGGGIITVAQYTPFGGIIVGSPTFNPGGNIASLIGDWPYGTNLAIKNTSTGGQEWDLLSEGSGGFAGAWALSNTTSHPFVVWDNNTNAPQIETLSNGSWCWSTTTTGGIPNANVNNCISSPGGGVISMDTTTPGNHAATVNAHAYQIDGVPFTGGSGAMSLISNQTLASAVSSVTFSSIPQTYNDLELVVRKCSTAANGTLQAQFNGDTTSGDYFVNSVGMSFSSSQTPFGSFSSNNASIGSLNTNLASTQAYFNGYTSATVLKPYTYTSVGQSYQTGGGIWNNSSAGISTILLTNSAGGNFNVGCSFSLYGIN